MEGEPGPEEASLFPTTVGEKLRSAREAQGLDLSEVAARTRIPQRHLEAIERSNYTALPSTTYALGFAKAYARAIGADEVAIGRDLRRELDTNYERVVPTPSYEMTDPTRTPSSGLAWVGGIVALLVLVAAGLYYGTTLFRGTAPPPETLEPLDESPSPTPAPTAIAGGQVSLVALDTVWLRVTDAAGKVLFEKEMKTGERFDVPADADRPIAKTGRPDKIQVMINGSNAPALGPGDRAVEVEVGAAALLARGTAAPAPAPSASPVRPTPSPRPTAVPTVRPASTPTPTVAAPTAPATAATPTP